ncbi:MAG: CvpA family protein [Clostridia bacterium]|nr:CvpA family protein [Clostridia bacterium]
MGILVDVIIIAIIVLSTLFAYRKGLAVLAIKLCAVIIAVIVTLLLYKPVSNLIIEKTNIDETIESALLEKSSEIANSEDKDDSLVSSVVDQAKTGAIAQTAKNLSVQIINISVIVILFFGIRFALKFVTILADKVAKLPIINQFNKIGGIIYGLVRGLVIVYACLLLISFVGQVNTKNPIHESVEESNLGKMMYENNVFKVLF